MGKDCMDLSLVARQARHNSERWFPRLHESPNLDVFYCLALAGEVGEVCNLVKKIVRHSTNDTAGIASELADVFTYLLLLADKYKVDLMQAFEDKQKVCEARWG